VVKAEWPLSDGLVLRARPGENPAMADRDLEAAAATAWAETLGCDRQLLAEPGWHMVPGGGRRWSWPTAKAVIRAHEVPRKIPAAASDSQCAPR
jgi:hypothetical protein